MGVREVLAFYRLHSMTKCSKCSEVLCTMLQSTAREREAGSHTGTQRSHQSPLTPHSRRWPRSCDCQFGCVFLTTAHPTRVPTCDLPVLCSTKHELRMVNFFLYWVVWCLRLFTAISLKEVAPLLDLNDSPWPAHLPTHTDSKGDAAASSSDAYTSVVVAWQSHRAGQIDKSQLRRDQADSPCVCF